MKSFNPSDESLKIKTKPPKGGHGKPKTILYAIRQEEKIMTIERAGQILAEMGTEYEEVTKTDYNNVKKNGLSIMLSEEVGAVVYPEQFEDEDSFRAYVADVIKKGTSPISGIDINEIVDYDRIKCKLYRKLINYDSNHETFSMIHIAGDIGCAFFVSLCEDKKGIQSVKVTNEMMKGWNKNVLDLYNDSQFFGEPEVLNMLDVMKQMCPGIELPEEEGPKMLVISNSKKSYGAAMVLTDEAKAKVLDVFPEGAIILPSSIHEVIAISVDNEGDFGGMVENVNDTCVENVEVLSNKIYMLDENGFREYEKEVV